MDQETKRVLVDPLIDNNPNSPDPHMRQYTLDRYYEAIDFSAELNCPYVVMIPGVYGGLIDAAGLHANPRAVIR